MKFWFSKTDKAAPGPATAQEPAAQQPPAAPAPAAPQQPAAQQPPAAPKPPPQAMQAPQPPPPPKPAVNQRELYRNLMDALYDSVLLVDGKGYVVDSNKRVEHTFGYSPSDMWNMPLQTLIKGFGPIILAKISEPLNEDRPIIISGHGIRKDGSLFDAEISVSKVKLVRSDSLLFTVRDITKRMLAMQEKMRAQSQAKPAIVRVAKTKVLRCTQKIQPPAGIVK